MTRKDLKKFKDNNTNICYYCSKTCKPNEVTVDHKTSKSNGGTNRNDNIVIACHKCNNEKGALNEREFGSYLRYKSYLKTLTHEQINEKLSIFTKILKEDNIKNGKRNANEKPYLIRNVGLKVKAVRKVVKEV